MLPQLSKQRLTSLRVTGLSSTLRCVNRPSRRNGSRSASSAMLFCVRTRFVRLGVDRASAGAMCATRLRASSSVRSRGEKGILEMETMSLSVKSIASWSWTHRSRQSPARSSVGRVRGELLPHQMLLTRATPRFSSAGILCPICRFPIGSISTELLVKCSICSFLRTS